MMWPDNYADARGFRGPWRLSKGQWERRVYPMSAATVVAETDDAMDYVFYLDGVGQTSDAYIIGPRVST